jgi:PAS domain S-box-containing protein
MTGWTRPALAGLVVLGLGLLLASMGYGLQTQSNQAEAQQRFDTLTRQLKTDLTGRLQTYEYGLRATRGVAVVAQDQLLGRDAFERYGLTRDVDREFPGARGFGIVWRVAPDEEARFVDRVRRDGRPDFQVRQLAPHAGERYVIEHIEPLARNRDAVGLDIASETTRRTAAQSAMRSGAATLTGPITLVQAAGKPSRAFLLLLPIYRPGSALGSAAQREAATLGWSYAPLVIDEVLQHLSHDRTDFTLALRDLDGGDTVNFYSPPGSEAAPAAGLQQRLEVPVFGRRWEADLRATPAFVASLGQTSPLRVAAVISLIAALCAALAALLARLAERTRSERREQARRAAIVDASDDAIIGEDLSGRITDWNSGATRLFGYPAEQALGRLAAELLLPPNRQHEDRALSRMAQRGERCPPFDSTRLHRDGSLIEVSITAAPILASHGRCVGFAKTLRDVREARSTQHALAQLNANLELQVSERTARLDKTLHDLRAILDAIPSLVAYWDRNLINRMANQAYQVWFAQDPAHMLGKSMLEVLGPTVFAQNRPYVEAALRGEPASFERTMARLDGIGPRHALGHYLPDIVDGEVQGFYVLVYDVSELVEGRRKLAAMQRDNEALLGTIQQHAIVSVTDAQGVITDANDAFCAIAGYAREALIGQTHRLLNSGHHDKAFWAELWATVSGGQAWRGDICNRSQDGSLYWVDSIIAPFVGADGQIEKYISIRNDITHAKQAEDRLRSSEAFLDRAGRIAGVGGWELDLRQSTLLWSAQTYAIHEVDPDFVPTLDSALDFYPPSARVQVDAAVAAGITRGTPWDLELPFISAKGRSKWVRAVGTAEFEDGQAVRLVGAFQDITERRQAAANLAYERQLMTSLMDTLPDQIYFKDRDSRFLRINPALARRYGLSDPAQAIGKSDADYFAPEHARRTAAVEQTIILSGQPVIDLEEQETWPDRPPTWNLTTKMPLHDQTGAVIGTFGLSRDITARRQTEEALKRSNQRFQVAAQSAALGVWEYQLQTGELHWDERTYQLHGRQPSGGPETIALWFDGLHPDDRGRVQTELARAIDGSARFDTTLRVVLQPQGEVRHLRTAAHVDRDEQGQALRLTGVTFDVSERVRAETELRQTMATLHAVLASATQASIIATRTDGVISVFNVGAQLMLGCRPEEVVGRESSLRFHDVQELRQRAETLSAELGRKVHTGLVLTEVSQLNRQEEWTYLHQDGHRIPVSLAVTEMRDDTGELFGYLGIAHDISQQKAQERQLREAIHKANQANQAKSQFLANMSHEIRTPMNAVIGLSYLLERSALDPDQASTLAKIRLASKALLDIINDVLDLSKIEAGEMQVEQAPFSLPQLLDELTQLMTLQAGDKGIDFTLSAPPDLPGLLLGDATRVRQVLSNLSSNAVKFTERGGVTLQVRHLPAQTDGRVHLHFAVQDSGVGIAASALDKLFTPFAQADSSTTRRFGGTGLGLSIVKQLVALMGGRLGVSSEPGAGSEFWVDLAFDEYSEDAATLPLFPATATGLPGVRVLVADDNSLNLEVVRRILELEGAVVHLVDNGQQALDFLADSPDAVDLVLMDVQMPVMDGLEATRIIRSRPALANLPIIALTAGITQAEHLRTREAGMTDIVAKPFNPQELVARIRRHVKVKGGAPKQAPAQTDPLLADWPEIPGIDARDVARRLGGDVALFVSMLQRLLNDSADLDDRHTDPDSLAALAARLHNLKGSAGTLGAKSIENLAARAELACQARQTAPAGAALRPLLQALDSLKRDAAPALQQARERAAQAAPPPGQALDPAAVQALMELLARADLGALAAFSALAPTLRQQLPEPAFARLNGLLDNLQFDPAVALLRQAFPSS